MKQLKISSSFSLPLEAVTQTFALLAKRGSGKSYTASVMAEEMLKARQQVVVLDPTGAWWGLQSSEDGKSAGFPVVIFGGDHANLPLEENAGELIAQAIVEQKFSAVIDLSILRKGQANRFTGIFLETLYRMNRDPLHLFIDEADAFAPQKPFGDQSRTLGAMEDIVRRGRKRGIGCTLITQRPAVINKNVLTQCEILFALRLSHPKDINAVMEWVNVHADPDQADKMIKALPSLPIGTGWLWSPGWMDVFRQVAIRRRETFDSGATPKPGETIRMPKTLAQVDIELLGNAIKEMAEQKKQEDPKYLKQQIAELSRRKVQETEKVSQPQIDKMVANAVKQTEQKYLPVIQQLEHLNTKIHNHLMDVYNIVAPLKNAEAVRPKFPSLLEVIKTTLSKANEKAVSVPERVHKKVPNEHTDNNYSPGRCERAIVSALVQINKPASKNKVAIMSGYSVNSGGFNNAISNLRKQQYITGSSQELELTSNANHLVNDATPLPTGDALISYWVNKLPKCESAIVAELIKVYPEKLTKERIGISTGYSHTSGGFNNALSSLRVLELITGYKEITAAKEFFE